MVPKTFLLIFILVLIGNILCETKENWWDNIGTFVGEKVEGAQGFITGGEISDCFYFSKTLP